MSSLLAKLAKAKSRLFGSAPESVPVPFEVPCDCGHRVTGIRRTSYQIAVCSACQSSLFVLPVNVYPTTKRIRSEVVDGPVLERVGTVVRDLGRGDTPPVADDSQEPRSARKPQDSEGLRDYGAAVDLKPKSRKSKRSAGEEDPHRAALLKSTLRNLQTLFRWFRFLDRVLRRECGECFLRRESLLWQDV